MRIAVLMLAALVLATDARAESDWNSAIGWQTFEAGLVAAKEQKKPVCLVFYTDWCPHCTDYSRVFHDARVVAQSKAFVMVRVNRDQHVELSNRFAPDGNYIPRTLFLGSDGAIAAEIVTDRPDFKYFYNTKKPESLLAGMEKAAAKLGSK